MQSIIDREWNSCCRIIKNNAGDVAQIVHASVIYEAMRLSEAAFYRKYKSVMYREDVSDIFTNIKRNESNSHKGT